MSNHLETKLRQQISILCNGEKPLLLEDFYVNTVISAQKIIQCAEELKQQLVGNSRKLDASQLLLLTVKLEIIDSDLAALRREYNL